MTTWFCQRDNRTDRIKRRNLDDLPSFTVAAGGMGDSLAGGYWIEDDTVKLRMTKRKAIGTGIGRTVDLNHEPSPTISAGGVANDNTSHYWIEAEREPKPKMANNGRPPYRVPSMSEISAVPFNGYSVVSTFSGCGGSCLGYRMAGFRVLWANEFEPNAAENYRLNFPDSILDTRDIRGIRPEEILEAVGKKSGEIDLLDGSPPCQSFSTAGKRQRHWGKVVAHGDGTTQRSDDLFFEYARILRGLQPKTFIAENVSGLVKGVAKGYFKLILAELKSCGYLVEARLLDAQWLGVPQMRQRIIFMGVRSDLAERFGVKPEFPRPLPYRYSVMDAIGDLIGENEKPEKPEKPSPTITAHRCADTGFNPPPKVEMRIGKGFGFETWRFANVPAQTVGASPASGNNLNNGANSIRVDYKRGSVKPGSRWKPQNRVLLPSEPSFTIIADSKYLAVTDKDGRRKFTIAELKRICAFPDDFRLVGKYAQQWARLGNSVPPIMAAAIAKVAKENILDKITALQSPADV